MTVQNHSGVGHNIIGDYYDQLAKHPSLLSDVINVLSSSMDEGAIEPLDQLDEIVISEKIAYNNLESFKEYIDDFKIFQGKIDMIYTVAESNGSNKKSLILRSIREKYLKVKAELLPKHQMEGDTAIDTLRRCAGEIFLKVQEKIRNQIITSNNIAVPQEALDLALGIVIVDAFIRCKIMEAPL
ncbi:hypothetical protein GCM10023092_25840 [Rurimicrobium arvi]|uniref:ABC-three component systems C-terminal domain-containing protein n=2 Tax=Rurimicrobium arvi TaxID=2049916 RepID=A0ABP8N242_9BACT